MRKRSSAQPTNLLNGSLANGAGGGQAHDPTSAGPPDVTEPGSPSPRPKGPFWCDVTHRLYYDGELLHHFRREGPHKQVLLDFFESHGWQRFAVDLFRGTDIGCKERLRQTVKNFNRIVGRYFRLRQEGNGKFINWEPMAD
jgi:hypothetical protein